MKTDFGFWGYCGRCFRQDKKDFLLLGLAVPLATLLCTVILVLICALLKSDETRQEILSIGLPGIFALCTAVLTNFVAACTRFSTEFRLSLTMNIPRRWAIGAEWMLNLATSGMTLALAAAVNELCLLALGRMNPMNLFTYLPMWSWGMMLYLPIAIAMASGGILVRFGKTGFWALYALFMSCCLLPPLLPLPNDILQLFLDALPYLGAAFALLCTLIGWLCLRRAQA